MTFFGKKQNSSFLCTSSLVLSIADKVMSEKKCFQMGDTHRYVIEKYP